MTSAQSKRLLDFVFSLPEAYEDHPWGETVAKVNKKVFAFLGMPAPNLERMALKLVESHPFVSSQSYAQPTGYRLGNSGWLDIDLSGTEPSLALAIEWVVESYRTVAPKRLGSQVEPQATVTNAVRAPHRIRRNTRTPEGDQT